MKQNTNNPPDKSPVDDLFARRLGPHSIAPDKAGWSRLQAKMAGKPEARVLAFWQNPTVYRYAAAACVSALLLAGGWLLLRPADSVTTPQNQVAATQKQGNRAVVMKQKDKAQTRHQTDQLAARQPQQAALPEAKMPINRPTKAGSNELQPVPNQPETKIAKVREGKNQPDPTQLQIGQKPDIQLVKIEPIPAAGSLVTTPNAPTKPVAEQVLIVTIAEPDALIEARQAANWSESAEKILVVDIVQKPFKSSKFLQQVARVRNGAGLELAGNDDQSLLSRAFQTIKNKTNNKSPKQ